MQDHTSYNDTHEHAWLLHHELQNLKPAGQNSKIILNKPSAVADPVIVDVQGSAAEGFHQQGSQWEGIILEDERVDGGTIIHSGLS